MLPIDDALITPIDLKIHNNDSPKSVAYKELMKDQLDFCRHNQDIILKRANKLYDIVVNHPEKTLISLKDVVTLQSLKLFCKNILKNLNKTIIHRSDMQSGVSERFFQDFCRKTGSRRCGKRPRRLY